MNENVPVITIDGPSGSGKGTIAQLTARQLGWGLLDSGALYRITALAAERKRIAVTDEAALVRLIQQLDIRFQLPDGGRSGGMWLEGRDVTEAIRTEDCARGASQVAALASVRQALLERQRAFRVPPGLVADGRDMGTVVFPDARVKIFLTASAEERARRRYKQLKEKGIDVNLPSLLKEINERDRRDLERVASPLKPAEDATVLDTTNRSIGVVFRQVLDVIRECDLYIK